MMDTDFNKKWSKCLELIRDNIGQARFDTWFACAKPVSFNDNCLVLHLPSNFHVEKYEDDFYEVLSFALKKVFGNNFKKLAYDVEVVSKDKESVVTIESPEKSHVIKNKLTTSVITPVEKRETNFDPQLNFSLTFENYCVGESNRLPVTIAEYIADNPGKQEFNPFFLYGSVGVGKTHLIQAIGIRIKEKNPNAKVLFIPMNQFQYLYANAVKTKTIPAFINWYQQMDVILFDDLHQLANKTGTADALFPIFNHLQQRNKNLIFTCDRPPVELDGIADRLIDRFKWGITEQLTGPDLQLRRQILEYKSAKNGLGLSPEVIDMIAREITGSVRELENIVNGLLLRAINLNAPITPQLVRDVMSHIVKKEEKRPMNFDMIVETTAEYYNLNPDAIFSQSRLRDIADARQMIMYLTHKHTSLSSPAIGRKLNRAHATVLHGISSIKDRLDYSKELSDAVAAIEADLFS